jgi:hypothetical protein
MKTAAQGDPSPALQLGPVLGSLPAHLVHKEVLGRLGPRALALLAGAGRGCAAAVAATALMQWAKRMKRTPPVRGLHFYLSPLCFGDACSHAARSGNSEVLEWLHIAGFPWNANTCALAAGGGYLEVLRWAREHHCPWDWMTSANAAFGGHLAVLQWSRQHDCPWDWRICMYAAVAGQLKVLRWVRENDATGEVWDEDSVRRNAQGPRKHRVLKWLDQLGAP